MDVLQNPVLLPPEPPPFEAPAFAPNRTLAPEGTHTPTVTTQENLRVPPSPEHPTASEIEALEQRNFESENMAPSTIGIPELPELPSEERLKTALSEQFSVERFDRAIQTLKHYGPKEGLRRLKVSDPEAAKRIESVLLSPQENK